MLIPGEVFRGVEAAARGLGGQGKEAASAALVGFFGGLRRPRRRGCGGGEKEARAGDGF